MEAKTWKGSCHCQAVQYEVTSDLGQVIACNCSMCQRSGTWLTFVPAAQFTLVRGQEALANYQFNKHAIDHLFCRNCGIKSFARGKMPDGSPMVAVNVRCLEGIDLNELKPIQYDGRNS